jgi:hypothetical protein
LRVKRIKNGLNRMLESSDKCNCFSARTGAIKCLINGEEINQISKKAPMYKANNILKNL